MTPQKGRKIAPLGGCWSMANGCIFSQIFRFLTKKNCIPPNAKIKQPAT
jgi:hypothetical protein